MYYYLIFNDKECLYKIESANKKVTNHYFGKKPFKLYKWSRLWPTDSNGLWTVDSNSPYAHKYGITMYTVHPRYFKLKGSRFFLSPDSKMVIWVGRNAKYTIIFKAKTIEKVVKKYPGLFDSILTG